MSKVVRKRLLQTMECIRQAVDVIEQWNVNKLNPEMQRGDMLVELLTDVQDLAIALGTRIEALKGA